MYKTTYGALLQEYVTSYETSGVMFKLEHGEFVEHSNTKHGHYFNLMSFKFEWICVGKRQAKILSRKRKKKLARLLKLKYIQLQKVINQMEES